MHSDWINGFLSLSLVLVEGWRETAFGCLAVIETLCLMGRGRIGCGLIWGERSAHIIVGGFSLIGSLELNANVEWCVAGATKIGELFHRREDSIASSSSDSLKSPIISFSGRRF